MQKEVEIHAILDGLRGIVQKEVEIHAIIDGLWGIMHKDAKIGGNTCYYCLPVGKIALNLSKYSVNSWISTDQLKQLKTN